MNAGGDGLDATLGQFIDVGDAVPFELIVFVSHYSFSSARLIEHMFPARREQFVPYAYQVIMGIAFFEQSSVEQHRATESFALPGYADTPP